MVEKRVYIQEIVESLGDRAITVQGDVEGIFIEHLRPVESVDSTTLDWVNPAKTNKQHIVESSPAQSIICDTSIEYNDALRRSGKVLIQVADPKRTLIEIAQRYFVERPKPSIHHSASIDENAKIGKNVYIGANCVIGECEIGDNSIIHPNVTIYNRTKIGSNTTIHSGAVICVDGLGCIREDDGTLVEFPQFGGVLIGNNVYIGANTHIASGSLSDTIIGDNCKINGMSFIGSNCQLSKNVWITGSTMLAGSVKVAANTTIFSRVVIREWLSIGSGVTIGMGSVVTKNVPSGETWVGTPAKKLVK